MPRNEGGRPVILHQDLLGRPHEPLRCLGYCSIVLARIFPDYVASEIPQNPEEAREWIMNPPKSKWREIGHTVFDARLDGDVVYGEREEGDGAYIAVMVNWHQGSFLTSSRGRGCHLRNVRGLRGVISVQRRFA